METIGGRKQTPDNTRKRRAENRARQKGYRVNSSLAKPRPGEIQPARPRIFTRSYRTGEADYDKEKVGWRVTELSISPGPRSSPIERRKIYDTTQPGRNNQGHTYGDDLTEPERTAVIEYLKRL